MQDTVSTDGGKRTFSFEDENGIEDVIPSDEGNVIELAASKEQLGAAGWNGEVDKKEPEPAKTGRKIAVLGSAVSSVRLAPFDDPTWEIWACSPANKSLPRCDVWFELHNLDVKVREGLTEWLDWLKQQPIVYMQKAYPDFKGSRELPLQALLQRWGPFWWTSQLAYMLALAIEQNPKTIGIFGVDMAANSEYNQQRLGCQYFIQHIVRNTDIELVVPPESDILEAAPLYGYCESSRQFRKYMARKAELAARIANLTHETDQKLAEKAHLVGAMDDMEYQIAHWGNRNDFHP